MIVTPIVGHSGECEKDTGRASVICLESKIDELSRNINNLESQVKDIRESSNTNIKNEVSIIPIEDFPNPTITATATSNSIKFDVISCKHHKLGAECEVMITSNRDDTDIFVYPTSRAYDENGTEYKIGKISIANSSADLSNNKYIKHRVIEGVPVKSKIVLTNVPIKSTRITALDIRGFRDRNATYDQYRVHAKLRNIALLP